MLHASTSPFYPLFASLDVGAQMMKGRSGEVLWDDTIRLGIEMRKKMRAHPPRIRGQGDTTRRGAGSSSPSCPTAYRPTHDGACTSCLGRRADRRARRRPAPLGARARRALARLPACGAGLRDHRPQQADPADAGLRPRHRRATPRTASRRRWWPSICARTRIVPEKNDLNSLLFLLTPGVESSKAGTLLSALVTFKRLHDDNAPLEDVIGEFVRRAAGALCAASACATCAREMHALLPRRRRQRPAARAVRARAFAGRSPWRRTRRCASWCATTSTMCRSTRPSAASPRRLFVVYPPGIASIVPGERLDERAQPMLDYLHDVREERQPVPRLRGRDPGHLSRDRRATARCASTPTWSRE